MIVSALASNLPSPCPFRPAGAAGAGLRPLYTLTVAVAIALSSAASASANRPTITVAGLIPDRWGATTSTAERNLRSRYPGITTVSCYGATIYGDAADSSFIHGLDRYWDKLACGGTTRDGHKFALIYDAKSAAGWIIYRLKEAGITDLEG